MKPRIFLVINPRSSGFGLIEQKILTPLKNSELGQDEIFTFEIQPTTPAQNAEEISKLLKDNDRILVAGGDGTAHIATNGATLSGKKNLKIKYTGFGNFNDYAHSFSKNSAKSAIAGLTSGEVKAKIRPLQIRTNGHFLTHAPLYATVGLTASMAEIFEGKRLRKALKKVKGRNSRLALSLLAATRFYFENRKNSLLNISKIEIRQGEKWQNLESSPKITDLVFMNGPRMARIMRSRANLHAPESFGFTAMNAGDFRANFPFLIKGALGAIPLRRVSGAKINFETPADITIQIEGEAQTLKQISTLEVVVSEQEIEVL